MFELKDQPFEIIFLHKYSFNFISFLFCQVLRSCKEIMDASYTLSGIYRIDPQDGQGGFGVHCDQETEAGGWTTVLRRMDGSLDFHRGWNAYVDGMGDMTGEFWIGLRKLRRLTANKQFTIRFDLQAPNGEKRYAEYTGNSLGDSSTKYRITVGNYSGKNPGWRGGGDFKNFWVGMCRWDPGTLTL